MTQRSIPEAFATRNGKIVVPAQTKEHLAAHPEVADLLEEAISKVEITGQFLALEIPMGRVVGKDGVVTTEPVAVGEVCTFASRPGRAKPSRVVVGIDAPDTDKVVVLAFPDKESPSDTAVLITSFLGSLAAKEPWDPNMRSDAEREAALVYWCSHALVHTEVMGAPFESSWEQVLAA